MLGIDGTDLLLFRTPARPCSITWTIHYYVLISGRWFEVPSLYGPWAFCGRPIAWRLPQMPATVPNQCDDVGARVALVAEAVIASSIPQTATIYRDKATLSVTYVGSPSFAVIGNSP